MGRRRLESAAECTEIAPVVCALEWGAFLIRPADRKLTDVREAPDASGIYAWYTKDHEMMYVGRSVSIRNRLIQHARGTSFWGGAPTYYSFREVPRDWIAGVEGAHIRVLEPIENQAWESRSVPFIGELEAAIEQVWRDVLPVHRDSLNRKYTALAEQIAARL